MYRQSDPHGVPGREVELQDETPHELPTESDASPDGGSPPHRVLSVSPTDLKKACTPAAVFSGELHDRIALLVIDMQETFRSVGAPLLPRIRPLIDLCQSADHCETAMVIFTQHGHEPDATEEEDGELGRFWGRENLIRRGTPPWELMAEIKPNAKRILDKQRSAHARASKRGDTPNMAVVCENMHRLIDSRLFLPSLRPVSRRPSATTPSSTRTSTRSSRSLA